MFACIIHYVCVYRVYGHKTYFSAAATLPLPVMVKMDARLSLFVICMSVPVFLVKSLILAPFTPRMKPTALSITRISRDPLGW